jgi:TPR repeat protein
LKAREMMQNGNRQYWRPALAAWPVHVVRTALLAVLWVAAFAQAEQQEPTFTEIVPGSDLTDPAKLIPLLERNDVRAMNNIGLLWARGVGVASPNYQEALRWWKEAARRGYAVSMNNIGLLYANGDGVAQDYGEALKWWRMSAERGNAWAMNSIGDLYENGQGVTQSYADAIDWYQRAADAGDGLAMYNLGNLFEHGRGVDADLKAAHDWYARAADMGIASAMHSLGEMIAEGRGLPADPAEGHAWLLLAQRFYTAEDHREAEVNTQDLARLSARLDADQLARSKEIAGNLSERIDELRRQHPRRSGSGESEI